jgi:hypothetical protein
LWTAAAVLGIVATATVAWAASQLATPNIGLSSEPPSVVSGLAPTAAPTPAHPRGHASAPRPAKPRAQPARHVATAPPAVTVAPTPAPITRAPVAPAPVTPAPSPAVAPATTATQSVTTPQPTSTAPRHPSATHHRDDSRGDGSGGSPNRRDD